MAVPGSSKDIPPLTPAAERMMGFFVRPMTALNVWVFKLSGGRIGAKFSGGAPVCLLTTTGRKTGRPRRLEIWFHYQDGRIFITGTPGSRGWYANMMAEPKFTWHFKQSTQRDLDAEARPVTDRAERIAVFTRMRDLEERMGHVDVQEWTSRSPLVEVELMV